MKAIHKFVQLSLIVAILLASTGFRVNLQHCATGKEGKKDLAKATSCCCAKAHKKTKSQDYSCNNFYCLVQPGPVSLFKVPSSAEQRVKFSEEIPSYLSFTQHIRPAILATIPHFTLPPPVSGRFIGILLQIFII